MQTKDAILLVEIVNRKLPKNRKIIYIFTDGVNINYMKKYTHIIGSIFIQVI